MLFKAKCSSMHLSIPVYSHVSVNKLIPTRMKSTKICWQNVTGYLAIVQCNCCICLNLLLRKFNLIVYLLMENSRFVTIFRNVFINVGV